MRRARIKGSLLALALVLTSAAAQQSDKINFPPKKSATDKDSGKDNA